MSRQLVVALLALLLGLQAVTTDLYLPTLPAIRDSLDASMGQIQLTLTALLLAFGLSQLVWGPLSDRFGRRPILLWGMGAYVIASVACGAAPGIGWLIAARTVQGIAMGAGVMAARAIVRDLYPPHEGAQVMSQALTGLGMIACTCAQVGGLLSDVGRLALCLALRHLVWRTDMGPADLGLQGNSGRAPHGCTELELLVAFESGNHPPPGVSHLVRLVLGVLPGPVHLLGHLVFRVHATAWATAKRPMA